MRKLFAVFSNSSSEDSINKKTKEKKTPSKKEVEEGATEQSEVKRQGKQNGQGDRLKDKSKKKPQAYDPPREDGPKDILKDKSKKKPQANDPPRENDTKDILKDKSKKKPQANDPPRENDTKDILKDKSKKKPQANDPPREEGKDTKVKKKKSRDRDSGLGEMIDNDDLHHSDSNRRALMQRRHMQMSQYGYFDPELEGEGKRSYDRHHLVQVKGDEDDDDVPLGLKQDRRSQENVEEKNRLSYRHSGNGDRSHGHVGSSRPPKTKVGNSLEPPSVPEISSSHSPVATTPPLVFNSRHPSRESRQYLRERKFSSSNSSESSASFDSGIRARQHPSPSTHYPPGKSQYYNVVSPSWNGELGYYEEGGYSYNDYEPRNIGVPVPPLSTPVAPTGRMRNLSLNLAPRSDSFTRGVPQPRRASDGFILSGMHSQPEKGKKAMKISEYHKYQEGNIAAQYHKYRVNPLPIADEPEVITGRPMTPTLMQIQNEYKSVNAQNNALKRFTESPKRISMTESNSSLTRNSQSPINGRPEHRKNHSETTIMQQQLNVPRAPQPQGHASSAIHQSSQFYNSATSLSSSGSTSGSGGPPTPSSRRSSVNIMGSRPGTPSTNVIEKRKKSTLSIIV